MKQLLTSFLLVISLAVVAQQKERIYNPNDEYVYTREMSGGGRLQTNGFSLFLEYGFIKNIFKTRIIQLEYQYFMDYKLKKIKSVPIGKDSGTDYFYGLQNKFHTIRINYGVRRMIAEKARRNGVRLSFMAMGGFSLGLMVPYYLDLKYQPDGIGGAYEIRSERYSEANRDKFLDKQSINEASPIGKGFTKIEPVPGVHGKLGLNFDFGTRDEFVKEIEAGVMADIFYKPLPLLINDQNRFYKFGAYISFQFGKRW
ncbi:MAG: hypothetical protein BGO32_07910 [Bacteroidetes bacterium 37-13]|nr:MAG: hypothetical protein BGO32_07910 [Bacteroidetes bacterium 37-13]